MRTYLAPFAATPAMGAFHSHVGADGLPAGIPFADIRPDILTGTPWAMTTPPLASGMWRPSGHSIEATVHVPVDIPVEANIRSGLEFSSSDAVDFDSVSTALMTICTESVSLEDGATILHPHDMPGAWLDEGTVTERTFETALRYGWKSEDVEGIRFLIPTDRILHESLPGYEIGLLAAAGIVAEGKTDSALSPGVTHLEDFLVRLYSICDDEEMMEDGTLIHVHYGFTREYGYEEITPENIEHAMGDGWTLIVAYGDRFLIPARAIGNDTNFAEDELKRLFETGLIGVRGEIAVKWQPDSAKRQTLVEGMNMLRQSAAGELDLAEFAVAQMDRWGGDIKPVVELSNYPFLDGYPKLREWLGAHLAYVEPGDMERLDVHILSAEHSPTAQGIDANMHSIQGVLGEIAHRPRVVAEYRKILTNNPNAILVVAPQIYSGSVLEASDAIVGEIVTNADGVSHFTIYAAWEVTSGEGLGAHIQLQMKRTLEERFTNEGCHLRNEEGRGTTLPVQYAWTGEAGMIEAIEIDYLLNEVLTDLRQHILMAIYHSLAGEERKSETLLGKAVAEGTDRIKRYKSFIKKYRSREMSLDDFADLLEHEVGYSMSQVFRNMVGLTRKHLHLIALASDLRISEFTVPRYENNLVEEIIRRKWIETPIDDHPHVESQRLTKRYKQMLKRHRTELDAGIISIEKFADLLEYGVGKVFALVFRNMTGLSGKRRSMRSIASDLSINVSTITLIENRLFEWMIDRGWKETSFSDQPGHESQRLTRRYNQMLKRHRAELDAGKISREKFADLLENETGDAMAQVFRNMTGMTTSRRSIGSLAVESSIPHTTIATAENRMIKEMLSRGWREVPIPGSTSAESLRQTKRYNLMLKRHRVDLSAGKISLENFARLLDFEVAADVAALFRTHHIDGDDNKTTTMHFNSGARKRWLVRFKKVLDEIN